MGAELKTGKWKLVPVLDTITSEYTDEMIRIKVNGELIESTTHHPFWVIAGEALWERIAPQHTPAEHPGSVIPGRWVDAIELRHGDVLHAARSGQAATIKAVTRRSFDGVVYNMTIAEVHCYAVGNSEVLVHNVEDPCDAIKKAAEKGDGAKKAADSTEDAVAKAAKEAAESLTRAQSIASRAARIRLF